MKKSTRSWGQVVEEIITWFFLAFMVFAICRGVSEYIRNRPHHARAIAVMK